MTGLLSDDGYIYQRKVVIYHIIEQLIKENLAECKIELCLIANSESNETYSLDFLIKTNDNKYKYFEVKKRKSLYLRKELKPIMLNFQNLYKSLDYDCEFILVYSSQTKYLLEKLGDKLLPTRKSAIEQIIGNTTEDDFIKKITIKQMIDDIDPNTKVSGLELQSIMMIDQILKRYNIQRYCFSNIIYNALRVCYEGLVAEASNKYKAKINSGNQKYPIKQAVNIKLEKLLNYPQSLVDKISTRFKDRDEALRDFCNKYSLPSLTNTF